MGDVFDSGLVVIEPIIYVPQKIETICMELQEHVGNDEFAVLFKGEFHNGFEVYEHEYYIPKQQVSGAEVEYLEDLGQYQQQGFNVICHSHPFTQKKSNAWFSSADMETICSHFDCSLLYTKTGITLATLLMPIEDFKFIVTVPEKKIQVYTDLELDGLDNITKEKPKKAKSAKGSFWVNGKWYTMEEWNKEIAEMKENRDKKQYGSALYDDVASANEAVMKDLMGRK